METNPEGHANWIIDCGMKFIYASRRYSGLPDESSGRFKLTVDTLYDLAKSLNTSKYKDPVAVLPSLNNL